MIPSLQLTFVEEIALLALDDASGKRLPMPTLGFSYALAGAALCDLSHLGRIDTDPAALTVLSTAPTGDPILDEVLKVLAADRTPEPVGSWLGILAQRSAWLEAAADDRLVERGILRREESKVLWVFGVRRYPTVDNHERIEVRTRLRALILGDDLPDPRDATLLSLLCACQLAAVIFRGPESNARADRLASLAKLDLVGREVSRAIDALGKALLGASPMRL
ncbi:MAG: GPP34 family phosphoprotein [Verrucomicrobia bacterium]|nr:GPP34 family phosphoprotein [Verrucomicrobiota bacterium]